MTLPEWIAAASLVNLLILCIRAESGEFYREWSPADD